MALLDLINMRNFKMALRNVAKRGLVTTLRYALSDLFFDLKYQVDTINTVMLDELDIASPNKAHGRYYEGTNVFIFKEVFSQVEVDAPNSCFIDFGSGKGKAMFLAAEMGFRKVIGVEFSRELTDICRRNLEIFRRKSGTKTEFEIVHMDAAAYPISQDANVLYFSNPFDEVLINKVIENILKSFEEFPREILALHLHPQGNAAFIAHPRFRLERETPYGYILRLKRHE
jgi:16S rRNA G966 N2-methylase RsmD